MLTAKAAVLGALFSTVVAASVSISTPSAAAAPQDGQCRYGFWTTAILIPDGGPLFNVPLVVCVSPTAVSPTNCTVPDGVPHDFQYILGEGAEPRCESTASPY